MKSLIMTSGEMDYEDIFRFQENPTDNSDAIGEISHVAMSHILWVVFVILMPILFANLLVSG